MEFYIVKIVRTGEIKTITDRRNLPQEPFEFLK